MPDAKSATDVLGVLVLSGLMGMVGQGARTIVGLKKLSDTSSKAPDQSDAFAASRIVVGLMIGFVAGVVAGLSLKILQATDFNVPLLLGLAAAGYAGTDFIEGFVQTIGSTKVASWTPPSSGAPDRKPVSQNAIVSQPSPKAAGNSFGFSHELQEAQAYKPIIDACAAEFKLPAELIYAVGSRESAWGLTLRPKGPGGTGDWAQRGGQMPPDHLGWGRGLMQADYAASEFAKSGEWKDPEANIRFGTNELADNIEFYTKAKNADPIRAGVAAYNCGRGGVQKAIDSNFDVDQNTTGHDYSRDVLKRSLWFKANA